MDGSNQPSAAFLRASSTGAGSASSPAPEPAAPSTQEKEREGREMSFPSKLHKIMSNPEFSDIITWLPHGRAWKMLNRKAFEEKVIPRYFRHCRYASFMRQVNGWGFNRIARGPDTNAYYHKMFLRGMPELCENIRRPTEKPAMKTYALSVAQTPDFYSLGDVNPPTENKEALQPPAKEESKPAQKATKPNRRHIVTILPQNRKPAPKRKTATLPETKSPEQSSSATLPSQQQALAGGSFLGMSAAEPQARALPQQQINNLLNVRAAAGLLNAQPAVSPLDVLQLANAGAQSSSNPLLSALRYSNSDAAMRALARTSVMQSAAASQALLLAQINGAGSLLQVPQQSNLVGLLGGTSAVGNTCMGMPSTSSIATNPAAALRAVQQQQQRDALRQLLNRPSTHS